MSHFTVLVATTGQSELNGEANVESILEPYNEDLEVEPYWEASDVTWARQYYASEKFDPPKGIERLKADATDEELVEWLNAYFENEDDDERYRIGEDKVIERRSTYNPDSKWDYWRVGGRWAGRLRLKREGIRLSVTAPLAWEYTFNGEPGPDLTGRADQAFKRDIDIEAMRQTREDEAQATWAKWQAIVDEHGTPESFEQVLAKHGVDINDHAADEDAVKRAREEYHAQPAVKAAKEQKLVGDFLDSVDEEFLAHTKDSFVEAATLGAVCGYAFLSEKTGWLEAGRMGWWGMGSDTPLSTLEFRREVAKALDELPDDAVLTMVDCHI